jgi:soluble lytic murein transglycosylase-like protein
MPPTTRRFNVTNLYDPEQNLIAWAQYLRELNNLFDGNVPLVSAPYNLSLKAVSKYR